MRYAILRPAGAKPFPREEYRLGGAVVPAKPQPIPEPVTLAEFRKPTRRMRFKTWIQSTARKDYECDHCGTAICASFVYERRLKRVRIGRGKTALATERRHCSPDCPDRYYA